MEVERVLRWMFEAPDDVITPEEFERWEKEQSTKLTEERSRELYDKIMERVKKSQIKK